MLGTDDHRSQDHPATEVDWLCCPASHLLAGGDHDEDGCAAQARADAGEVVGPCEVLVGVGSQLGFEDEGDDRLAVLLEDDDLIGPELGGDGLADIRGGEVDAVVRGREPGQELRHQRGAVPEEEQEHLVVGGRGHALRVANGGPARIGWFSAASGLAERRNRRRPPAAWPSQQTAALQWRKTSSRLNAVAARSTHSSSTAWSVQLSMRGGLSRRRRVLERRGSAAGTSGASPVAFRGCPP